jgi:hypothetical protein
MMRFSLTEAEHAEVRVAASRAGRARAAFAAEATLAAARGTVLTPDTALDDALGVSDRLDHAAEQVRKVGVNLNQAAMGPSWVPADRHYMPRARRGAGWVRRRPELLARVRAGLLRL